MSKSLIHKIVFKSALPWALGMLIFLELVLHTSTFWQSPIVSDTRSSERTFEAASQRSPSPKIVILGSSRFQNAIVPAVIEKELGLATGDVSNVSFPAATPQDFLHLYKSEREYFSNIDLLIYEVGEFQYNWSTISNKSAGNLRYRQLADINTKLNSPGLGNKVDYGLGSIVNLWDTRFVFREMLASIATGGLALRNDPIAVGSDGRLGIDTAMALSEHDLSNSGHSKALGFEDFTISGYQLGAMAELLDLARADGISIVMPTAPFNTALDAIIEDNFAQYDELWRSSVSEVSGIPIANINFGDDECTEWEKCFWDLGHVNSVGANSFSLALANYLGGNDFHSTRTVRAIESDDN